MEKDPQVEPVADDLATRDCSTCWRVREPGWCVGTTGVNLMLLFGDPGDPTDDSAPDPGGG